jgi:hypothetical protein
METTAVRSPRRPRNLKRRLVLGGAAVAAAAAIGLGVGATPASAQRNDPCATARAVFRANMNEARFWLGAADQLAAIGNTAMADAATTEANYYMGLAEGALGEMSDAC